MGDVYAGKMSIPILRARALNGPVAIIEIIKDYYQTHVLLLIRKYAYIW